MAGREPASALAVVCAPQRLTAPLDGSLRGARPSIRPTSTLLVPAATLNQLLARSRGTNLVDPNDFLISRLCS
jgi:hypothetical protein